MARIDAVLQLIVAGTYGGVFATVPLSSAHVAAVAVEHNVEADVTEDQVLGLGRRKALPRRPQLTRVS